MYHIFIKGATNPVYTYKTWAGLRRRLGSLAADTTLRQVVVEHGGEGVTVSLHRGPNGYSWQTPVGFGIEHDGGLWCSGFSRSW